MNAYISLSRGRGTLDVSIAYFGVFAAEPHGLRVAAGIPIRKKKHSRLTVV